MIKLNYRKKIIIIGAGVAGLVAGCYAQMNGFESHIFEKEPHAGGLCASWKIEDLTIPTALYFFLLGNTPSTNLYNLWTELLPIEEFSFITPPYFFVTEYTNFPPCFFPTSLEDLGQYLLQRAPQDKLLIQEMLSGIQTFIEYELPIDRAYARAKFHQKWHQLINQFPLLLATQKWANITVKEWANSMQSVLLAQDILQMASPESAMLYPLALLAYAHQRAVGYLIGGGTKLIQALQNQYMTLGGNLHLNTEVKHIRIRSKKAVAVGLGKQQYFAADYIVACCDLYHLYRILLQGEYFSPKIAAQLENFKPATPMLLIMMGIKKNSFNLPFTLLGYNLQLTNPIFSSPNTLVHYLKLHSLAHDPTLTPSEYFLLTVQLPTEFTYWHQLYHNNKRQYYKQKQSLIAQVILALEHRFPGFANHLVFSEAVTPAAFWRHTYNFQGSYAGWCPTPTGLRQYLNRTVEEIENLYIAGHWFQAGGGIPAAAITAQNTIQAICAKEKLAFGVNA
ncbi:MAG: NAD(P)/FAD-dependent oxidoreductase [Bacteroidia bacterium]|nr:NAD(P)/FAD-dependent oxidoreductase [Bacteroidia bacterium]MDW8159423.1 NAD(P)/FAD-dependent oxidoreductase [Bacteroidia bacterium]